MAAFSAEDQKQLDDDKVCAHPAPGICRGVAEIWPFSLGPPLTGTRLMLTMVPDERESGIRQDGHRRGVSVNGVLNETMAHLLDGLVRPCSPRMYIGS